jgi:NTE family protein
VLPAEAVDQLRSAAGKIIAASPEFQRLLKDSGEKIVEAAAEGAAAPAVSTPPEAAGR